MNKARPLSSTVDPVHEALVRLVDEHRKLKAEPLHLAVHFQRSRRKHVYLFEVLGGFGGEEASPDREFFEVGFGSTKSFPLPAGRELRLLLTSPSELEAAAAARWADVKLLLESKRAGTAVVLYQDAIGKRLWKALA